MALIHGYRPQIVALDIIFSIQFAFILFLPYFRFRSVLPNSQASSGEISEALQATQRQLYWRYIESVIGATLLPALKGEAWQIRSANLKFSQIFFFAALRLLAEYESQRQQYWRSIKERKEQAKSGHLFAALRLLLQKSPIYFAALTGNGIEFNTRRRRIKNSK